MEINSADKVTVSGVDEAECLATMVEIKIKTLDSQTYTLRVNKCMPIPALKEQIATVTGVLSEQQRLICRGKVLKDDQLLSAYHVEDGHTLHLVVRQPFHSSSSSPLGSMGSESTRDHLADPSNTTGLDRGNHVTQNVVLGTFNVADQGDGIMPDLSRIISAVLGSIGIGNIGSGSGVIDHREHGVERLNRGSGTRASSDSTQPPSQQTAPQAHLDPLHGSFHLPTSASLGYMPPTVIPDSLMTLSHYLSHMKREFDVIGRSHISDSGDDIFHGMEGQGQSGGSRSGAGQGLPTPASLAEVIQLTRQTLIEQAGGCLSQLARQLEDQGNVTDHPARMNIQSNAIRSGVLLQNLGALLLELGRTTMTLRMGHTPAEAVVNAGPAVFISTAGPNPILVQPLPFQPGTSFGRSPMETAHPGHGLGGGTLGSASDLLQRNIDIRIRTGPLLSTASTGRGERAGAREPPGQSDPAISGVNLAQQPVSGASGSPSFTGESGVRVVPVRTVVATVPAALSRPPSDSAGSAHGLFYPLLARFPHLSSGNMNDTRGSQAPSNNHPSGPGPAQQQVPSPAGHQQNLGSNTRREGNSQMINFPPAIAASVVSNINPPANTTTQHQEGDGSHDAQESTAQVPSRFDQLLRTIFSGEQIHASEINLQASATGSTMDQMETNRRDEVNESSRVDMDPGVLFSSLLQQIMPLISQTMPSEVANASSVTADTAQNDTESNSLASQIEREILSEVGGSHSRRDPPSPPSSKRQKVKLQ